jgi:DNA mismatch endonuclease (patch repair protein)
MSGFRSPRPSNLPFQRSQVMRRIRKTNTGPERKVRQLLTGLGARYRLNVRSLPGTPDIVLRKEQKVIFVHGCFWHQHDGCRLSKQPSVRPEYWLPKLKRNRQRDREALKALQTLGWATLVVWECELENGSRVRKKLQRFFMRRP